MPAPDVVVVESRAATLRLTPDTAAALALAGERLASDAAFWGDDPPSGDAETRRPRTIIECTPVRGDLHRVVVRNAVGVVATPEVRLLVAPKIPEAHFSHLLRWGMSPARTEDTPTDLAEGPEVWDLVAGWFVGALEDLLRAGLLADYREHTDTLPFVRGQVRVVETVAALQRGRVEAVCRYDELTIDSALNRVLFAAARAVEGAPLLARDLRRRARRVASRIEGVGPLEPGDLSVPIGRLTESYGPAISLARHVLTATGRSRQAGHRQAATFLIPTPMLVEQAIRAILDAGLPIEVTKRGRQITGSRLTLNPDLVFGDRAVGDVKYKVAGDAWRRPDLYQLVAFATGYRVRSAALIAFATEEHHELPQLSVGDVVLQPLLWRAHEDVDPSAAGAQIIADASAWLSAIDPRPAARSITGGS